MKIDSADFVLSVVGSHNAVSDEKRQIAFVGSSNVGKSSLINMLTERKNLVRSSSTPGKTQQINYFLVNDAVYFVDLPGYGYAKTSFKQREKLRRLILWYLVSGESPVSKVVLIVDAKVGLKEFDREMIGVLDEQGHEYFVVMNKCDKLNQKEMHSALQNIQAELPENVIIIPASATSGRGRDIILEEIMDL